MRFGAYFPVSGADAGVLPSGLCPSEHLSEFDDLRQTKAHQRIDDVDTTTSECLVNAVVVGLAYFAHTRGICPELVAA